MTTVSLTTDRPLVSKASPAETHGLNMTEISRAIGLSRIVLIIGLVFLHYGTFPNSAMTPFHGLDPEAHSFATWLNSAVLFFFFSAVPLLSMISGWLFFSFLPDAPWPAIFRRIRKRFFSLYLPLIVWNMAYLLAFYEYFLHNPDAPFFTRTTRLEIDFQAAGPMEYLNALTGLADTPFAFQFWFVRDLFVAVLISPLFWLLLKRAPFLGAAVLGALWLYGYNGVIFFRPDVPFFFYLGALLHDRRASLAVPRSVTLFCFGMFVVLAGVRALAPYAVSFEGGENPIWLDAATRLMRLFGVVGCWGLIYRAARTSTGQYLSVFGGLAFFLHSAHFPLLSVVKAGLWKLMPGENDFWMLTHALFSVAVTVGICLAAGLLLAKWFPRFFALMNGGRGLTQLARQSA